MYNHQQLWAFSLSLSLVAVTTTGTTCPGTYSAFGSGCFKYVTTGATYANAYTACHNDEDGWLATLNTNWRLGVVSNFGISDDTYFGLMKTTPCTGSGCDGNYAWDIRDGSVAPVGNYTLDMKRYMLVSRLLYLLFGILYLLY